MDLYRGNWAFQRETEGNMEVDEKGYSRIKEVKNYRKRERPLVLMKPI